MYHTAKRKRLSNRMKRPASLPRLSRAMLVAAKPTGSKRNPSLGPGIVDTLTQRIDAAWGITVHISVEQMGHLLFAMFPEHFIGPGVGDRARKMFRSGEKAVGRLTAAQRQEQERRL